MPAVLPVSRKRASALPKRQTRQKTTDLPLYFEKYYDSKLDAVLNEIKSIHRRIDETNKRMDERFAEMLKRSDDTNKRMDERFAENRKYMDERFAENRKYMDDRFAEMNKRIDERFAESNKRIDDLHVDMRIWVRAYIAILSANMAALIGILVKLFIVK